MRRSCKAVSRPEDSSEFCRGIINYMSYAIIIHELEFHIIILVRRVCPHSRVKAYLEHLWHNEGYEEDWLWRIEVRKH